MSFQTDKIQLIVGADTKGAINQLGYLQAEYKKLEDAKKLATTFTGEQAINNSMSVMKEKIEAARKELGLMGLSQTELNRKIREHNSEASKRYAIGSEQAKQQKAEAAAIKELIAYEQRDIDIIKETVKVNSLNALTTEQLINYSKQLQQELSKESNLTTRANQEKITSINEINALIQKRKNIIDGSQKTEIESIQKIIRLNGMEALSINELEDYYKHLTEEIKKYAGTNSKLSQQKILQAQKVKEYTNLRNDEITQDKRHLVEIRETIKANGIKGLTTQQLINYSKHLQDELQKESNLESELNKKRIAESTEVKGLINNRTNTIAGTTGIFSNLKGNLLSATIGGIGGGVASAALATLSSAVDKINQKIDQLATKSDALADLQLAFQSTAEEAKAINKELGDIDTRTKTSNLRGIATQGGLLNVPRVELQSFVQAADEAVTVMQKDFPGGVEETTNKLGKLKELFAETKDLSFGEAIKKDASAIKTLADNGTATAGSMTEFALTMGQLPPVLRPTLTQTLGLGAAFEEAGFNANTAATNLTKTLLVSANNTDKIAGFFGKTRKEVEQLINTKPNEFLLELAQRLSKLSGTELAKTLDTLKLSDTQVVEVLGVLGTQIDNVRAKQDLASKSFEQGTRITEAFNIKNNTFAANLEKLSKNWTAFVNDSLIGKAFSNMTTSIVEGLNKLLEKDKSLTTQFDEQTISVKKLDREVKPLLDKYDELSKNKSAESQAELKKVIGQIINVMPTASYEVDKYGNAISVNTGKTREFIEQQRAMLQLMNKGMIDQSAETNIKARQELAKLGDEINRVQTLKKDKNGNPVELQWGLTGSSFVQHDLQKMNKRADELRKTINSSYLAWKGFKGEMVGGNKPIITPPPTGGLAPTVITDKQVKDAEKLQKEIADNEKKLISEIENMHIEAIEDETLRKTEKLKADFNKDVDINYQLVAEKKLSQSSYESWLKAAEKNLDDDIADIKAKATEKQEKADIEAARNTAKMVLDLKLAQAESAGDSELILQAKISLRKQQFDVDIEKATAEQKLVVWERYLFDVQKLIADDEFKKAETQTKGAGKLASLIKQGQQHAVQNADKEKSMAKEKNAYAIEVGRATQDALFTVIDARFQKQENRENTSFSRSQSLLEKQKNEGTITEDEYQKRKLSIEHKHEIEVAKIKRKQAIADKANALAAIAINTAIGASKVVGQTGVLGIPLVAFVIAQGAMQAATVLAQPLPALPSFFDGGITPQNFQFPVNDGKGGGLMIGHPNEFVMNARATSSPIFAAIRPILESANAGQSITNMSGGSISTGVAASNNSMFGELGNVLSKMDNTVNKLEKRLSNLQVRLGGPDYEHIGEEINYQKGIDSDAMIYNTKL